MLLENVFWAESLLVWHLLVWHSCIFHHTPNVLFKSDCYKKHERYFWCADSSCLHFADCFTMGSYAKTAYGKTLEVSETVNHKKLKKIRLLSHDGLLVGLESENSSNCCSNRGLPMLLDPLYKTLYWVQTLVHLLSRFKHPNPSNTLKTIHINVV